MKYITVDNRKDLAERLRSEFLKRERWEDVSEYVLRFLLYKPIEELMEVCDNIEDFSHA